LKTKNVGQEWGKSVFNKNKGSAKTGQTLAINGAEGRNRTADTGIFSPLP